MSELESYEVETVVRGYHVYEKIWEAAVGEVLSCQWEGGNVHNPYAVAVIQKGLIVGHVPCAISAACNLFLRRNGTFRCQVIGTRHYSVDLPQGAKILPGSHHFWPTQALQQWQDAATTEPTWKAWEEAQDSAKWFIWRNLVRAWWDCTVTVRYKANISTMLNPSWRSSLHTLMDGG